MIQQTQTDPNSRSLRTLQEPQEVSRFYSEFYRGVTAEIGPYLKAVDVWLSQMRLDDSHIFPAR